MRNLSVQLHVAFLVTTGNLLRKTCQCRHVCVLKTTGVYLTNSSKAIVKKKSHFGLLSPLWTVLCFLAVQCAVNGGVVGWRSNAWTKLNNDNDNGQLATMSFHKRRSDTYLRLTWSSNMRQEVNHQCSKWYFQINGRECTSPAPVDGNVYQSIDANIHRHGTIVGLCRGTSAGTLQSASYTISIRVGGCPSFHTGNAFSGWYSTSTMIVEELCPPR